MRGSRRSEIEPTNRENTVATRVAINGFGRIGRCVFRRILETSNGDVEVVAVNDLGAKSTLLHLLQWDSVQGQWNVNIEETADGFTVDGHAVKYVSERDIANLPWGTLDVDVVVESTGLFTDRVSAARHLDSGARKVVISAPGKDVDFTVVLGVNDSGYDPANHHVISNASCTTNCLAPMAKILHEQFGGIESGFMTTCHAYTSDQRLLDAPHSDLRRARAAALSVIPTSTGAAKAIGLVIPELKGKLDGMSLRVPVPCGSITDFVATVGRETTVAEVNEALRAAAVGPMAGILEYSEAPLVSADIVGNPHSSIIDGQSTMVNGRMVKLLSWYDNEWGYSSRTAELVAMLANDRALVS